MEANELDLVDTQELMEALFRRCRAGVIMLMQDRDETSDTEAYASRGNESFCLGLCEAMSERLRILIRDDFSE